MKKRRILIVVWTAWGIGDTISDAWKNCLKALGTKKKPKTYIVYDVPEGTYVESGCGDICYDRKETIRIIEKIKDGKPFVEKVKA